MIFDGVDTTYFRHMHFSTIVNQYFRVERFGQEHARVPLLITVLKPVATMALLL